MKLEGKQAHIQKSSAIKPHHVEALFQLAKGRGFQASAAAAGISAETLRFLVSQIGTSRFWQIVDKSTLAIAPTATENALNVETQSATNEGNSDTIETTGNPILGLKFSYADFEEILPQASNSDIHTASSIAHPDIQDYMAIIQLQSWRDGFGNYSPADQRILSILARRLKGESLEAIGGDFKVTRERIRQICKTYGGEQLLRLRKAQKQEAEDQVTGAQNQLIEKLSNFVNAHVGIKFSELKCATGLDDLTLKTHLKASNTWKFVTDKDRKEFDQIWSDEQILSAITKASTYFYPLSAAQYSSLVAAGEIQGPSKPLILHRFKSWSKACELVGVECGTVLDWYVKRWSRNELLNFVNSALRSPDFTGSHNSYESWRKTQTEPVPSAGHLRNYFGSVLNACDEALSLTRDETWQTIEQFHLH